MGLLLPCKIEHEWSLGVTFSVFCQHRSVFDGLTCQNKENNFFRIFDHFTYFPQYLHFQKRPNGPFTNEMPHMVNNCQLQGSCEGSIFNISSPDVREAVSSHFEVACGYGMGTFSGFRGDVRVEQVIPRLLVGQWPPCLC